MNRIIIPIRGMHCQSCEMLVEDNLKDIPGITKVEVSQKRSRAEIYFDGAEPDRGKIEAAVKNAGCEVGGKDKAPWFSKNPVDYKNLLLAAIILGAIYFIAKKFGLSGFNFNTENAGLLIVFAVGLVAGISTCMALVGGLVLALSARHAERHPKATAFQKFRPHLYFNLGRIGGFALFGGLIGAIGSALKPSPNMLGILTVVVGGVMIFLGLKLTEIFPALKEKTFSLPKSISRFLGRGNGDGQYSHRGAATSGAFTFFLPCGFTQAMQLYAVSSGSFFRGALIMSLFALGTSLGLLDVGALSAVFKGKSARLFFAGAGITVIFFGWVNIANGTQLLAWPKNSVDAAGFKYGDFQEIRMTQYAGGYAPNIFHVKRGMPIKWIIDSKTAYSCASFLVMPKFGISQPLQSGENIITFTPTEVGEISFSCSMWMYRGKFIVE